MKLINLRECGFASPAMEPMRALLGSLENASDEELRATGGALVTARSEKVRESYVVFCDWLREFALFQGDKWRGRLEWVKAKLGAAEHAYSEAAQATMVY